MNKALFTSMQEQLTPSQEVLNALNARLESVQPAKKHYGRYAALAACAAVLAIAAIPIYRSVRPPLHDYTVTAAAGTVITEMTGTVDSGGGVLTGDDRPAPVENVKDVAVPGVDADVPNTGDLPGGAYIGAPDVAAQEDAVMAYERLMAHFRTRYGADAYPDWYGGAYINEHDVLVVAVVESGEDQKPLYLEIEDLCGSDRIGFTDAKYSYAHLRRLQDQVVALTVEEKLTFMTCGVDEEENKLHLQVNEASDALLAALHRLDPDGDAIAVTVSPDAARVVTDLLAIAE